MCTKCTAKKYSFIDFSFCPSSWTSLAVLMGSWSALMGKTQVALLGGMRWVVEVNETSKSVPSFHFPCIGHQAWTGRNPSKHTWKRDEEMKSCMRGKVRTPLNHQRMLAVCFGSAWWCVHMLNLSGRRHSFNSESLFESLRIYNVPIKKKSFRCELSRRRVNVSRKPWNERVQGALVRQDETFYLKNPHLVLIQFLWSNI